MDHRSFTLFLYSFEILLVYEFYAHCTAESLFHPEYFCLVLNSLYNSKAKWIALFILTIYCCFSPLNLYFSSPIGHTNSVGNIFYFQIWECISNFQSTFMLIRKERLVNRNSTVQPSVLQIQCMLKRGKFLKDSSAFKFFSFCQINKQELYTQFIWNLT